MILGKEYKLISNNINVNNIKIYSLYSYMEFLKRQTGVYRDTEILQINLYDIMNISLFEEKLNRSEALELYNKLIWMNNSETPFRCKFKNFDVFGYMSSEDICTLEFMTDISKYPFNIYFDNLSDFLEKFYYFYLNDKIPSSEKWYDYF